MLSCKAQKMMALRRTLRSDHQSLRSIWTYGSRSSGSCTCVASSLANAVRNDDSKSATPNSIRARTYTSTSTLAAAPPRAHGVHSKRLEYPSRSLASSALSPSSSPSFTSTAQFSAAASTQDKSLPASQSSTTETAATEYIPNSNKPLGMPIPFDEHACSVSLPTWSSVVGYEEGDESVTTALQCGYPRFVYHPYVIQLMGVFLDKHSGNDDEDCLVLPTKEAALRCQAFLQQALERRDASDTALIGRKDSAGQDMQQRVTSSAPPTQPSESNPQTNFVSRIRTASLEDDGIDIHAVLFPAETSAGMEAKAYWQHTGELVSSRCAEFALRELGMPISKRVACCPKSGDPVVKHNCDVHDGVIQQQPHQQQQQQQEEESASATLETAAEDVSSSKPSTALKHRIMEWTHVPEENIFLTQSGMSSIYKALRSSRRYQMEKDPMSRGGTSIVFGFPYLDTLKMCSRTEFSPDGVEFFGKGDDLDLRLLERLMQQRKDAKWSALMTEAPSNPLLQCPDLEKLRELADKHDFCLVVDDTIGNFLNIDLIDSGLADAVCTSLTKLVSGRGDAMAGSIILNPNTEKGRWMQQDMMKDTDVGGGLHESDARAMVHNSADFPQRNDKINETAEQLADFLNDHPDVEKVWYPKFCAPLYAEYLKTNGGYGGLMSIHLDSHMCQRTFYDVLDVAKGPSLGTNFTLVCPYTLLAHYHELDFAMSYDVSPNLIRIAVGLEDFDTLRDKFDEALKTCELYPKLSSSGGYAK